MPEDIPEYTVMLNLRLDIDAHGQGRMPSKVFQLAAVVDVHNNLKGMDSLAVATVKEQIVCSYRSESFFKYDRTHSQKRQEYIYIYIHIYFSKNIIK